MTGDDGQVVLQDLAKNVSALVAGGTSTTRYLRHHGQGEDGVYRPRAESERYRTRHRGLLLQLVENLRPGSPGGQDGRHGAPGYRAPVTGPISSALQEIKEEAEHLRVRMRHVAGQPAGQVQPLTTTVLEIRSLAHAIGGEWAQTAERCTRRWVSSARLVLGFDAPPVALRDVRCEYCQHPLHVHSDAEGEVWCPNPACRDEEGRRRRWGRAEWPFLLERMTGGNAA